MYNIDIERLREREFPMLKDEIYLDHAGTTLYSRSLMERFTTDMISNLYGNPHSSSASSLSTTKCIDDIRVQILRYFGASPDDFEVIFVANATAGVKLVMDAFRSLEGGYVYGYHKDSHTSLIGVRENAKRSRCLEDKDIERWLVEDDCLIDGPNDTTATLFAYPAQSNMDGRKLPLHWASAVRNRASRRNVYTLLDAAALVATSPLNLGDLNTAPDFTVLSFNKIFGFPDLGALIVRKSSGHVLRSRAYFGGGTVDMVMCLEEQWHAPKEQSLHDSLEDGTLPIHNIMALDHAMLVHKELFQTMEKISQHTMSLTRRLFNGLKALRHANGLEVCHMYAEADAFSLGNRMQGPVVTFNMRNSQGGWVSNSEVEKLALVKRIHIRTGGLCNPGGIATALGLSAVDLKKNFSAGFRCGSDNDIMSSGKPTGVIRASLGAMSANSDVDRFLAFVSEFYVESAIYVDPKPVSQKEPGQYVESLTIYPIKSCGGYSIPTNADWEVRAEGLAWDREWCLIHSGTGQALSQKRYPRMALIKPVIDFAAGVLRVHCSDHHLKLSLQDIAVPLLEDSILYDTASEMMPCSSRVCGDAVIARTYADESVNEFFTRALDVPCILARFPPGGSGPSTRHAKAHMQRHQTPKISTSSEDEQEIISVTPPTPPDSDGEHSIRPILLSNESPILMINRSSIDTLNKAISETSGKLADGSVFRANIVVASREGRACSPYGEDHWTGLRIGGHDFKMLGACRRCHMICVDQTTAVKDEEPFVTLAKTRRFDGKVFFGSHMCHVPSQRQMAQSQQVTIRVGDEVMSIMAS